MYQPPSTGLETVVPTTRINDSPYRAEIPYFINLYKQGHRGLVILGINTFEREADASTYAKRQKISLYHLARQEPHDRKAVCRAGCPDPLHYRPRRHDFQLTYRLPGRLPFSGDDCD